MYLRWRMYAYLSFTAYTKEALQPDNAKQSARLEIRITDFLSRQRQQRDMKHYLLIEQVSCCSSMLFINIIVLARFIHFRVYFQMRNESNTKS